MKRILNRIFLQSMIESKKSFKIKRRIIVQSSASGTCCWLDFFVLAREQEEQKKALKWEKKNSSPIAIKIWCLLYLLYVRMMVAGCWLLVADIISLVWHHYTNTKYVYWCGCYILVHIACHVCNATQSNIIMIIP